RRAGAGPHRGGGRQFHRRLSPDGPLQGRVPAVHDRPGGGRDGGGVGAWAGIMGTYAEKAAVPADRLVPLPEGLSARDGAAAMLQGMTAHYLAVSTYPLKPGDTC